MNCHESSSTVDSSKITSINRAHLPHNEAIDSFRLEALKSRDRIFLFAVRPRPFLPRKRNLISRHTCRWERFRFSIPHIASRMAYAVHPALSAMSTPSVRSRFLVSPLPNGSRNLPRNRKEPKSWGLFLTLNLIFVSPPNFTGIPSTVIGRYLGLPSLVCSSCLSPSHRGEHWVITPVFRGRSSRRAASQRACPLSTLERTKCQHRRH